jgi:xanthine dehydrogenase accessory factor
MSLKILVRGGGDLASGVILRLKKSGWNVLVTELKEPMAVRRSVAFSQAIYNGSIEIESMRGLYVRSIEEAEDQLGPETVPVMIDPDCNCRFSFRPDVLVDARMMKQPPEIGIPMASGKSGEERMVPLVIGLGPGFITGLHCHAVIETKRGPFLGRVIWNGGAEPDNGIPDGIGGFQSERVLRAPISGSFKARTTIGAVLEKGQIIAEIGDTTLFSPFDGLLRGLIQDGFQVSQGMKVGDIDPRQDARLVQLVSDKALSVGGGVLECILTWHAASAKELLL